MNNSIKIDYYENNETLIEITKSVRLHLKSKSKLSELKDNDEFKEYMTKMNENVICKISFMYISTFIEYNDDRKNYVTINNHYFYITQNYIFMNNNFYQLQKMVNKRVIEHWFKKFLKDNKFDDYCEYLNVGSYSFDYDKFANDIVEQIDTLPSSEQINFEIELKFKQIEETKKEIEILVSEMEKMKEIENN